jgi:uncharacterized lipoprotein
MGNVVKKISIIVLMSLILSACGSKYSSNGEAQYLKSRNGEKIDAPQPLTKANISNFNDLPPQNENAKVSINPPI